MSHPDWYNEEYGKYLRCLAAGMDAWLLGRHRIVGAFGIPVTVYLSEPRCYRR